MINNYPIVNIYEKESLKSKLSSQLLYGERFQVLNKKKGWLKIKTSYDKYTGFIKRRKFIKLTSTASAVGLLPIQLKASLNFLNNFSNCNFLGRKIVLIELKGGNDGLNTIIQINVYDEYMDLRPTTHIPISSLNFLNSIDPSILGTNQDMAKKHYVEYGFNEGRIF